MKKTIILSIIALAFAFTNAVKADIALSGYVEFFAGSADQSKLKGIVKIKLCRKPNTNMHKKKYQGAVNKISCHLWLLGFASMG